MSNGDCEVDKLNKTVLRISVRAMVEFLLREGDIDRRHYQATENAMLEGGRIHRMIQRRKGGDYRAEVPLNTIIDFEEYSISVEGRADGIFTQNTPEAGSVPCIDEIKGMYRDLRRIEEPYRQHLAQAKCYGAMYLLKNDAEAIGIQMTYCNMDTEEIKYFNYLYDKTQLLEWFFELVEEYKKWTDFTYQWRKKRQSSIKDLDFPFEYRPGQKELAGHVYRTIYHEKRLFVEAPTGVGKTISTLFPAIKALGENKGDMIFYLTAKNLTGTVAENTYELLRQKGLCMKTVRITAREKMCIAKELECNPEKCPYAKGHYDRINEAVFALLNKTDSFSREAVIEHGREYMVCPFELGLDMSLFSDGVVCDYNYVFDPDVRLKRFFAEGGARHEYLFLIDEAHNLVDRAREMYSACIYKEHILKAAALVKPFSEKLSKSLRKCNRIMLDYLRAGENARILASIDDLLTALLRAAGYLDDFLEDDEGSKLREELLDFYFELRHFLNMAELLDDNYIIYSNTTEAGDFFIKLFCVNPADNLRMGLDMGRSCVFFSATLLPVPYYMDLLSGDREDYAVYAPSPFDAGCRGVFVANDVSSKYTRRGPQEYKKIVDYIHDTIRIKKGNYMVFFPSYYFLEEVYALYSQLYGDEISRIICQQRVMDEQQREEFIAAFEEDNDKEESGQLVGFCVMGGVFSEGIDLQREALIGAIIVGTGLPQVGAELEFLKDYFDRSSLGRRGFDYAYRIPGMNKVLQSAGRVIRTADDVGIVLLLDDRFTQSDYRALFPREWTAVNYGCREQIIAGIEEFWAAKARI